MIHKLLEKLETLGTVQKIGMMLLLNSHNILMELIVEEEDWVDKYQEMIMTRLELVVVVIVTTQHLVVGGVSF